MPIGTALQSALESFATVERGIVDVGQQVDGNSAVDFVRMRKQLVMEFATVGGAIEKDPWLSTDPSMLQQATRLLSAFRAQNSINQANWPVVRVKDNLAEYQIAARPVAERSAEFWRWVEDELGFKRNQAGA